MEPANRRLIRPALVEVKDQPNSNRRASTTGPVQKKVVPPEQTNAENFYYVKQMQSKTPMVIVLQDGETIEGTIEWYDKSCLKIHRDNGPNVLLYKPCIKYMYKA
jgi:host factor-I protein